MNGLGFDHIINKLSIPILTKLTLGPSFFHKTRIYGYVCVIFILWSFIVSTNMIIPHRCTVTCFQLLWVNNSKQQGLMICRWMCIRFSSDLLVKQLHFGTIYPICCVNTSDVAYFLRFILILRCNIGLCSFNRSACNAMTTSMVCYITCYPRPFR